ncbi:hypothetical protein IEQ34_004315 [Dendrobium chrysotoxum]|uniref:Uncharacterized protein n=1 Tax=Dendrobium chrysotoxum TaxID=161865 RepID=A0AAV7HFK2_DENCH|nr:hypothetical protein IEQ34_004315 [Dendrobium chrysotoxum]
MKLPPNSNCSHTAGTGQMKWYYFFPIWTPLFCFSFSINSHVPKPSPPNLSFLLLLLLLAAFFLSVLMDIANGQKATMASSRWLDGKAIDQGIAYFLMLVALLIIFLVH